MIYIDKNELRCPTCGSKMRPCTSFQETESTFWMECTSNICHTYVNTYIPLKHQIAIHKDEHRYVGVFGGYGSGKTYASYQDDVKHMLTTPNGTTVVGSAVLAQVEQTYQKDLFKDLPKDFVQSKNKAKSTYTLVNGHNLLIKSYYEEGLLRSLTVSRAHIVEASEVNHSIFVQLQSRLRDTAGTVPERDEYGNLIYDPETQTFKIKHDWRKMIIESNPDAGWIRDNFLLKSSKLYLNNSQHQYFIDEPNKDISTHVIPTKQNIYLPPNFYEELAKGKPSWWVRRYLEGSFDYAEGMVYPNALSAFCNDFEIPPHWKRIVSWDYGIRDDTAIIFLAVDQQNGIAYAFNEIAVNNMNYESIATIYKQEYAHCVPEGTLYTPAVMDARSINKRNDFNLMTIGDMFGSVGVYLEPAKMDLEARMLKVNTLIESGRLKIFGRCKNLRREIMNYKFPERTAEGKMKPNGDKPVDKNNHSINALEFGVMELPDDLKKMENRAYDDRGHEYSKSAMSYFHREPQTNSNPYGLYAFTNKQKQSDLGTRMNDLFTIGNSEDIQW